MRLLVSVADAAEARAALGGGADIIDAKEPRHGALGVVAPEVLRATAVKDRALFELLPPATVSSWVAAAHRAGLFAALAGSLRGADFATARDLGADVVGVRAAACVGGRTGRVRRARVARLRAL